MNSRIINLYSDAIRKFKKGEKIDVLGLPVPPGFSQINENIYDGSSANVLISSKQPSVTADVKNKLNRKYCKFKI